MSRIHQHRTSKGFFLYNWISAPLTWFHKTFQVQLYSFFQPKVFLEGLSHSPTCLCNWWALYCLCDFTWLPQRRKVLIRAAHLDFSCAALCSAGRIWKQLEVFMMLKNTSKSWWSGGGGGGASLLCQPQFPCCWHFIAVFANPVCCKSSKLQGVCASMNALVTPSNLTCLNQMTREEQKLAARISTMRVDGKTSCGCGLKKSLLLSRGSSKAGISLG